MLEQKILNALGIFYKLPEGQRTLANIRKEYDNDHDFKISLSDLLNSIENKAISEKELRFKLDEIILTIKSHKNSNSKINNFYQIIAKEIYGDNSSVLFTTEKKSKPTQGNGSGPKSTPRMLF